ncbi:MAG: flagellar biosynthesis protein FlhF [Burkholderiaceae bacterium]|nr:flagellar biosynthesis protein FlhF [Burkholderiaceae bacterium]
MNIKRFYAATAREALAKARMTFGEGTLILSNRPTPDGVEVVATAEESISSLDHSEGSAQAAPPPVAETKPAVIRNAPLALSMGDLQEDSLDEDVHGDTEQLAMSTLSFQDYVRERMLRRRHEALQEATPMDAPDTSVRREPRDTREHTTMNAASQPTRAQNALHPVLTAERKQERLPVAPVVRKPVVQPRREPVAASAAPVTKDQGLFQELQSVKNLIEDRFNTLSWLGQARQNPIQSNLMLKLIRSGYSPSLARAVLERLPDDLTAGDSVRWLMEVLERNLKTDIGSMPLYEEGGVYALVGATGVGKTTTTAKLAALCAQIHGPASVGLITLDTYRVGAHDQLRTYGRMLGVVAHQAHDQAALQDLLGLLSGKKMVLIDTTGVAPRDPRKRDMLDVLALPHIKRLLVLNAGSHGDTLDDVLTSFKTTGSQQAILSKIDEAVKLGPALDALIRHQMVLRGVTNGQRVPEDWATADANKLVSTSMRSPARSAFDPKTEELNFFFTHSTEPFSNRGALHA